MDEVSRAIASALQADGNDARAAYPDVKTRNQRIADLREPRCMQHLQSDDLALYAQATGQSVVVVSRPDAAPYTATASACAEWAWPVHGVYTTAADVRATATAIVAYGMKHYRALISVDAEQPQNDALLRVAFSGAELDAAVDAAKQLVATRWADHTAVLRRTAIGATPIGAKELAAVAPGNNALFWHSQQPAPMSGREWRGSSRSKRWSSSCCGRSRCRVTRRAGRRAGRRA